MRRELGILTYLALGSIHRLPAAGTLVGDFLGTNVLAEVGGDLGAVVLHVQEVGGEGALGRIGVGGGALALLGAACVRARTGGTGATSEVLSQEAGRTGGELKGGFASLGELLGVLHVGFGQFGDVGLNLHQAHHDLFYMVRMV